MGQPLPGQFPKKPGENGFAVAEHCHGRTGVTEQFLGHHGDRSPPHDNRRRCHRTDDIDNTSNVLDIKSRGLDIVIIDVPY